MEFPTLVVIQIRQWTEKELCCDIKLFRNKIILDNVSAKRVQFVCRIYSSYLGMKIVDGRTKQREWKSCVKNQ
jgi:hypothetical protein